MELYAIEEQIKTLEKELNDTIRLSQESGGNSKRFTKMVGGDRQTSRNTAGVACIYLG